MQIKWLGHSTFLIKNKKTILTDPHDPLFGIMPNDLTADIVTVSHEHVDHNYTQAVKGNPKIIKTIGDFLIDDIKIKSLSTWHDDENGTKRGSNIVFIFEIEKIKICHLGDLGHVLTIKQISEIGKVDILMIPVGGFYTIDAAEAKKIVEQIKPKIVLPMHYKTKNSPTDTPLVGVEDFVNLIGWKTETQKELNIDLSNLSKYEHKIILFEIQD